MIVAVTKSQSFGNEVLATFTSLAAAEAFAETMLGDPGISLVECKLVVGPFGMKMIPVA